MSDDAKPATLATLGLCISSGDVQCKTIQNLAVFGIEADDQFSRKMQRMEEILTRMERLLVDDAHRRKRLVA